jgi:hypothetical protein
MLMSAPLKDENLLHRARVAGDGRKVHLLANHVAAYESAWDIGQEYGWDVANTALLAEAETALRIYLNQK